MNTSWFKRAGPYLVLGGLGCAFLSIGLWLGEHPDEQATAYNRGLALANAHRAQEAIEAFDTAATFGGTAGKRLFIERLLLPQPDPEVAALALAHKGFLAATETKQAGVAIESLEQSLAINSGDLNEGGPAFASLIGTTGDAEVACAAVPGSPLRTSGKPLMTGPADVCRFLRMREEAMIVVFDLEQLTHAPSFDGARDGSGERNRRAKSKLGQMKPSPGLNAGGRQDTKQTEERW